MMRTCGVLAVFGVVLMIGCAAPGPPSWPICPGKADVEQALSALAGQAEKATSFRATGECLLTWHAPDSGKQKKNHLPVKLWFDPPSQVYIQGSIALDAKAVIIGSNEDRFWLALRPKEMSSYYTGRWEETRTVEGLMMSPKVVLEAFGIVVQAEEPGADRWTLTNEGPFDILTLRDAEGRPVKRVSVYACDYTVYKIEYFDGEGNAVGIAELRDYESVVDGFRVPTHITVTAVGPEGRNDSMDIEISAMSMKVIPFSDRLKELIFTAPDTGRFEHVYTYRNGRWVAER